MNSDDDFIFGIMGLCITTIALGLIGLFIWGFVKIINWVVTLG